MRENVKVRSRRYRGAKLYADNKKPLEIGSMSPLDANAAESVSC